MVGEGHERAVRLQVGLHLASREPGAKRNEMTEDNITDDDWRKIELQYRALGLIELGRRRREASDYGKYLRLTDRGDRHLIHLRAIQRPTQTN
jgi:hypothetical protein